MRHNIKGKGVLKIIMNHIKSLLASQKLIWIGVFAVLLLAGLSIIGQTSIENEVANIIKDCAKKEGSSSSAFYACVTKKSSSLIEEREVGAVMRGLEKATDNRENIRTIAGGSCHNIAHALGERSMELSSKNLNDAVISCDKYCSYGCVHGAILQLFKERPVKFSSGTLDELCPPSELTHKKVIACRHGVGHGLAEIFGYDVIDALEGCNRFSKKAAKAECASGVFMQAYITETAGKEVSKQFPPNARVFCSRVPEEFEDFCLRNSVTYKFRASKDAELAFETCRSFSRSNLTEQCILALGNDMPFIFPNNIERVAKECQKAKQESSLYNCLKGAIYSTTVLDPSYEMANQLCKAVYNKYTTLCKDLIELTKQSNKS